MEELEVPAGLSLVLVLVAREEELPDTFNLDLQSHPVRISINIKSWGAPDLTHKNLSPSSLHPQEQEKYKALQLRRILIPPCR